MQKDDIIRYISASMFFTVELDTLAGMVSNHFHIKREKATDIILDYWNLYHPELVKEI